ncbi:insulinase family protein [Nakamurella antarctica]|uniref:Insulinase family protein n=1 Tax=Nakamurella antarctica TaxID=1902245 RepID=A0A3G8ZMN5_9ACTN|nr:insulinase family protein [Nakamurella antarctica]AZI58408.1 insulinase family protein [Nakamurella antarctica]
MARARTTTVATSAAKATVPEDAGARAASSKATSAKTALPRRRAARSVPARTAAQIGITAGGPRTIPELTSPVRRSQTKVSELVLESGLRVIVARKAGTPLVELRLRIPFGGKASAAGTHAARAEVLAASVMLGTKRRDREGVDAELATVGGHLGASVDAQRLVFAGSVLSTGIGVLVDVLADTLTGAAYRAKDVAGERDRLVEHLLIASAQPGVVANRHLQRARFGDHPAAWDMPEAADVALVTPAVVRSLHQRSVVPAGATLVMVGDLQPAAALRLLAKALEPWQSDRTAQQMASPPAVEPGSISAYDKAGAVQSQVRLSGAAVGRDHEGYAAQQLANLIYGGYFSSRLVENIREDKGYTYSARSGVEFWPGAAALTIAFDSNTESTAAALWETRYELGRIALVAPTSAEVESARSYALGTLAASLATQSGYASMLSSLAGSGLDAQWLVAHQHRLATVTADEVHAMARVIFAPSAFMGVVVGDLSAMGSELASIGGVDLP